MALKKNIIIACFNQKGGSGKTTTAFQMADTLGRRNFRTAVADIDRQATNSFLWGTQRAQGRIETVVATMSHFGSRFLEELQALHEQTDIVFIDCPPVLEDELCWQALMVSDLILVPVPPVKGDVISSLQAGEFAATVRGDNPDVKIAYFVAQNRRGRFHTEAIRLLSDKAQEPVFKTIINQRAVFAEAQARHCAVQWLDPNLKTSSAQELDSLADEICDFIGIPKKLKAKSKGK